MAVVTVKSKTITNRDSKTPAESRYSKALLKEFIGSCAVASGDSIGSKYVLGMIPSNARFSSLVLSCTAITSAAADIGLYNGTALDGTAGTVVSASFFTAAKSIASALDNVQVGYGNVVTLPNCEKMVWELLGLASDPGIDYDVVATLTAAATAAGTVAARGHFVV